MVARTRLPARSARWRCAAALLAVFVSVALLPAGEATARRKAPNAVVALIGGGEDMPDRSETDRYFEMDAQARDVLHRIYGGG